MLGKLKLLFFVLTIMVVTAAQARALELNFTVSPTHPNGDGPAGWDAYLTSDPLPGVAPEPVSAMLALLGGGAMILSRRWVGKKRGS